MRCSGLQLLLLLLLAALITPGCREGGEEVSVPPPPVEEAEDEDEAERSEPRLREVYGLPLPPEYMNLRQMERRTEVTTRMSMDEVRAFFESRSLADHEVLEVGNRLELVPLRPHLASARVRYFRGPRTGVIITYLLPPDPAELARRRPPIPEVEAEEGEPQEQIIYAGRQQEQARQGRPTDRPEWLDSLRGQPVNLRTETGELLAPDARWGEPYIPPEGSPLHTERNRHNFGRPFGDWRSH